MKTWIVLLVPPTPVVLLCSACELEVGTPCVHETALEQSQRKQCVLHASCIPPRDCLQPQHPGGCLLSCSSCVLAALCAANAGEQPAVSSKQQCSCVVCFAGVCLCGVCCWCLTSMMRQMTWVVGCIYELRKQHMTCATSWTCSLPAAASVWRLLPAILGGDVVIWWHQEETCWCIRVPGLLLTCCLWQ